MIAVNILSIQMCSQQMTLLADTFSLINIWISMVIHSCLGVAFLHYFSLGIDIMCLNETWLSSSESDQRIIGDNPLPVGYTYHPVPRVSQGVGVAILCYNET